VVFGVVAGDAEAEVVDVVTRIEFEAIEVAVVIV
jgi:hypothetical protein